MATLPAYTFRNTTLAWNCRLKITFEIKSKLQFTEARAKKQTCHKSRENRLGKESLFQESMGHYVKLYPDVYTAPLTHTLSDREIKTVSLEMGCSFPLRSLTVRLSPHIV